MSDVQSCCVLVGLPFPFQVCPWDVDTDVEERLRQEEAAKKAAAAAAAAEELARQEAAAEAARQKRRQNQRARLGESALHICCAGLSRVLANCTSSFMMRCGAHVPDLHSWHFVPHF